MLLANQIAEFFEMQYFKKEVNDEVYFWLADKNRSFLQIDATVILLMQACSKYPEIRSLYILAISP